MKKTELFLWSIFIVLSILHAPIHFSGIFLVLVGFLLSNFYFIFSTFLLNGIQGRMLFKKASYTNISEARIVKAIFIGFAYSLAVMAIVFMVLSWPGAMIMLILALIPLLILTIITSIKNKKNPTPFYKKVQQRNFILIAMCIALLLAFLLPAPIRYKMFPLKEMEIRHHR